MGIPELFGVIGEGELTSIAQLAAGHFQQTGRPLRVAVDEAGWRFNNLTEQQVYAIRQKSNEPAYNGIEKNLFYRLCPLLGLNVRLLFVFDGKHRPWKRGKASGKIDWDKIKLVKQLLSVLKIPYHEAPAEAEAECVMLQRAGIVDAVWSEDSDALMFGCDWLIRDYRVPKGKGDKADSSKENTKKSAVHVLVHRSQELRAKHQLDREGLVLFAVLVGGDYDTTGLRGCGSASAMRAVKHGLGHSLCRCRNDIDLSYWRDELREFFEGKHPIPQEFPRLKHVKNYNSPMVSTKDQAYNLRGLRHGWDVPFDEAKLLKFTSERFNIWGKGYMNWIAPILLTKALSKDFSGAQENTHKVQIIRKRINKADANSGTPLVTKVSFSPFGLTTLTSASLSEGNWTGMLGVPVDQEYRVEAQVLDFLLRRSLPSEVFEVPQRLELGRKRKRNDDEVNGSHGPVGGKRKPKSHSFHRSTGKQLPLVADRQIFLNRTVMSTHADMSVPTVRESMSTPPCRATFSISVAEPSKRQAPLRKQLSDEMIDFLSDNEDRDDGGDEDLKRAIQLSLQEQIEFNPSPFDNQAAPCTVPDELPTPPVAASSRPFSRSRSTVPHSGSDVELKGPDYVRTAVGSSMIRI